MTAAALATAARNSERISAGSEAAAASTILISASSILEQIAKATRALLISPDYQRMLVDSGFEATPESSPEHFRRALAGDVALWTPIVKALDLRID